MNWPRVKMILIILFLCINIFLLYNMFSSSWRSSSIDRQTIANVVEILSKNGITVNGDLIAPRVKAMKSADARNITNINSAFMKGLEENGWTEDGQGRFERDGSVLTIDKDKIYYENPNPQESDKELKQKQVASLVVKELGKLSLDVDGILLQGMEQTETGYRLHYAQSYDGYEIFGTYLTVTVTNGGISALEGVWLDLIETQYGKHPILHSVKALLSFVQDSTRPEGESEITAVTPGYYIGEMQENVSHITMQMVPCWQITTATGKEYYYDARNPEE